MPITAKSDVQLKRRLALVPVMLVTLACCGCGHQATPATEDVDVSLPYEPRAKLTLAQQQLATGYNEFGFRLLRQLAGPKPAQNIALSPESIAIALALTQNGAAGSTQHEIAKTLGLKSMSQDAILQANAKRQTSLQDASTGTELTVANSLWTRAGIPIKPEFIASSRKSYAAEIKSFDASDPKATDAMDAWVQTQTRGKIQQLVQPLLDPAAILILLNAVYFKGIWQAKFDPSKTQTDTFTLANGTTKQVPFMHQQGRYLYFRGPNFQAVNLPYAQGRVSLYVLLPDQGVPLTILLKSLDKAHWSDWLKSLSPAKGEVQMPRFKLDSGASLVAPLQALGIKTAFDPQRANFTPLTIQPLTAVSAIKHEATIEVNEEGAEAAAATEGEMTTTSNSVSDKPFSFVADHPFLAMIQDNETNSILFLSLVLEP